MATDNLSFMKIITWNCNMAFRKKAEYILQHQPDILVVPECEHPDKLIFGNNIPPPTAIRWYGNNPDKGLGIFTYNGFRLRRSPLYTERFRWIVPLSVSGGGFDFTLFAVWAHNPDDPDGQYVTQVWKAVHYYDRLIRKKRTLLTGDFNSNTIWDKPKRAGNHSSLVKKLEAKGIQSLYHRHYQQKQGTEADPTFYLYRKKDRPYHLDYCFASADMAAQLRSLNIGEYARWCKHSDHVPVMVEFDPALYKSPATTFSGK